MKLLNTGFFSLPCPAPVTKIVLFFNDNISTLEINQSDEKKKTTTARATRLLTKQIFSSFLSFATSLIHL